MASSIYPFVHLPDFRIVICSQCRYACVGNEIERHLSKDQHKSVPTSRRGPIGDAVRALHGIIHTQSQLDDFAFPEPTRGPILDLGPPYTDGMACDNCTYVVRCVKRMQKHYRQEHGWVNSRRQGGQRKYAEVAAVPWREGVQCQRFFPGRKASRYFEVLGNATLTAETRAGGRDGEHDGQPSKRPQDAEVPDSTCGDSDLDLADVLQQQQQQEEEEEAEAEREPPRTPCRVPATRASPPQSSPNTWLHTLSRRSALLDKSASRAIHNVDEKLEPNPWVRRVGWARHLADFKSEEGLERLRSTLQLPRPEETALQALWDSYTRVVNEAQKQVCSLEAGAATLFEMARDTETKRHTPFQPTMAREAWVRYRVLTGKLLLYLWRTQSLQDEERPRYELTPRQDEILGDLEALLQPGEDGEDAAAAPPFREGSKEQDRLDDLVARLLLALFDHHYHSSPYESVVISGLAVMGIRDDNGWVDVSDYTMRYSAVIKVMRIMVVARSITEMEREVEGKVADGYQREEAKLATRGLFERVRQRMDRFMVRASARSRPGVMDWILSSRTYGMAVSFNTPSEGHIQWDGPRVSYKRVQFKMDDLREMMEKLIDETKDLLGTALCLDRDPTTQAPVGFPDIPWDELEDDQSDTRLGHWFALDERNPWPVGRSWLAQRISQQPELWRRWNRAPQASGQPAIRPKASTAFNKLVDAIRGRLLVLMHMSGGGPGRSAEILNLRIWNTRQGGTRNIFIYHKMVCTMTKYHKKYLATDKLNVIYRFLPREVGELLIWYLWLVLPFWQAINSVTQQADYANPFLFGQNAVYGQMSKEQRMEMEKGCDLGPEPLFSSWTTRDEEDGDELELEEEEAGFRDGQHVAWSADKMRRLMTQLTGQHMGVEVNISSWRHIWIAISRKFLIGDSQFVAFENKASKSATGETDVLSTNHSSFTRDIVYAREAMTPFSTFTRRDKFETDSKIWHRFLKLGSKEGTMIGKRRLEPFEQDGDKARLKRQKRLAEVDILGRLRQMLDDPEAQFRPGQERVLQAIHKGYSPVLQIVGTASGKSLSFMLPAYCAGDGVTIVIVPLIALREDMVRRCEALQIRTLVWSPAHMQVGSGSEAASIVFVTPESATHAAFATYMRVLRARSRLDRIVVDECHMILDSASQGSRFRPAFLKIGEMLANHGVQIILLTATLAPRDEATFFAHVQINRESAAVFRSSTSRRNIAYSVCEVEIEEEDDVEEGLALALEDKLALVSRRFPGGKVIIYCGTVARTVAIGKRLECPAYHNQAGNAKQKTQMLEGWIKEGRLIAATNALGVGLDIPCIRAVVHITPPRRLRDFAQESGRAGRDGQDSMSIIIRRQTSSLREGFQQPVPPAPTVSTSKHARRRIKEIRARAEAASKARALEFIEDEMVDYLEAISCRRAVLDSVMDGDHREDGCDNDVEQPCDLCRHRQALEIEPGSDDEGDLGIVQDNLQKQALASVAAQEEAKRLRRIDGDTWAHFNNWLEAMDNACMLCIDAEYIANPDVRHDVDQCPNPERSSRDLQEMIATFRQDVLGSSMEQYAGCKACGLPQSLCDAWEEDPDDGGSFTRSRQGTKCQFPDLLARLAAESLCCLWTSCERATQELARSYPAYGVLSIQDDEGYMDTWLHWMGRRTQWAGHETNFLCKFVYLVMRQTLMRMA